MVDQNFLDDELPDDFLYAEIALRYKEDPLIKVMSDPLVLNGVEMSRIVILDYNEQVVHVGAKRLEEPYFLPKEDFISADMVMDWFEDYSKGYQHDFPDIPKPQPVVPYNQLYKPEDTYAIEMFFGNRHAFIVDPKYCVKEEMLNYNFVQCEKDMGLKTLSRRPKFKKKKKNDRRYYFFPYKDVPEDFEYADRKVISMQFNPFHPLAIHMIQSMEWETQTKVKGHYKYNQRKYYYSYDLNDERFRVHSHIWLQLYEGLFFPYGVEVFDLVANFDFSSIVKFVPKDVYVEPLCIEPIFFFPYTEPQFPFSRIGGGNRCHRGISDVYFSPYHDLPMKVDPGTEWFIEITSEVTCRRKDSFLTFNNKKYFFKNDELDDQHIFFRWGDDNTYRVFHQVLNIKRTAESLVFFDGKEKFKIKPSEEADFLENFIEGRIGYRFIVSPLKFHSFPRNKFKGLAYSFKTVTLQQAVIWDYERGPFHEYLPILSPHVKEYYAEPFNYSSLPMVQHENKYSIFFSESL